MPTRLVSDDLSASSAIVKGGVLFVSDTDLADYFLDAKDEALFFSRPYLNVKPDRTSHFVTMGVVFDIVAALSSLAELLPWASSSDGHVAIKQFDAILFI